MYFFIDEAFVFNLANSSEDVFNDWTYEYPLLNLGLYQKYQADKENTLLAKKI